MADLSDAHAMVIERSCALTAVALSGQRREGVRLVTGERRSFGLSAGLDFVHVPYPPSGRDWTRRTLTCGVALQCSPSKERLVQYRLNELSTRELCALTVVEGSVALGWIASSWPGLLPEIQRVLPGLETSPGDTHAMEMLNRAIALAGSGQPLDVHPLLGSLPSAYTAPQGWSDKLRRSLGRMPWTTTQKRLPRPYSAPVGGDGGVRNPNLPPPSRPQDNDLDITPDHRPGIPYPEWNAWTKSFLPDHVAVLERALPSRTGQPGSVSADLRKWFEEHTHRAMKSRLEDGSDVDVEQYVSHYIDVTTGEASEPRIFRELLPSGLGLATGGYTRLGAPLRHLTSRLLAQPSERRLLIVIGDGLLSDEGYEGRYAWADAAHAVEEANDAGVSVYYVGVGPTRLDPLPEIFGPRRSQRIRRVEELPRVLAHVHRELVST